MLVYAIFPLLLVDPRSTDEGGVLLIPVSGFADNLLIALSTSFFPFAKSCNADTKLRNSILSEYIPVCSMSELVSSSWISSKFPCVSTLSPLIGYKRVSLWIHLCLIS